MLGKIIKVDAYFVTIGMNDGGIIEVSQNSLNFLPYIGDVVEVYKSNSQIIVRKVTENSSNIKSTVYTINGKLVNKVAYVLLAFFLGGFGVHKFYAGKIGMGILYLLFCWTFIPGCIALIEAIIALTKPSDIYGNIII